MVKIVRTLHAPIINHKFMICSVFNWVPTSYNLRWRFSFSRKQKRKYVSISACLVTAAQNVRQKSEQRVRTRRASVCRHWFKRCNTTVHIVRQTARSVVCACGIQEAEKKNNKQREREHVWMSCMYIHLVWIYISLFRLFALRSIPRSTERAHYADGIHSEYYMWECMICS